MVMINLAGKNINPSPIQPRIILTHVINGPGGLSNRYNTSPNSTIIFVVMACNLNNEPSGSKWYLLLIY